jgi:YVTN family beta-propeller protein
MLVAHAGGSLWVGRGTRPELKRIDPRTGRELATVAVGGNPGAGLVRDGTLWVPNHLEDTVSVITVATDEVRTVQAGRYPSALLEVDGDIWVASFGDGTIRVLTGR